LARSAISTLTLNAAAVGGEGYLEWSVAYELFYVKYAEQYGQEVAD
jgi:hypothetical protein